MAIKKYKPTNVSYKQARLEDVRPDVSKITRSGNDIALVAIEELTKTMGKLDAQYTQNEEIEVQNKLKKLRADADLYQAKNPEMYFSKEDRTSHEKEITNILNPGLDLIRNSKTLSDKTRNKLTEDFNNGNKLAFGYRDVKFLEAYKERVSTQSLTEANRLLEENKATTITQENVNSYNENSLRSANLIYSIYDIKGDSNASRPVIENNELKMINADLNNDLNNIVAVPVTDFNQYQIMADNIQIRADMNAEEIKGRVDKMFEYDAYKNLPKGEIKKYKQTLYTRFENESRQNLEEAKLKALKAYERGKQTFLENQAIEAKKADEDYAKKAQKMYNLNDKGQPANAYYEASGMKTDGGDLVSLDSNMWADNVSISERIKPGNNSYIPTIVDVVGLKDTVKQARANGETTLDIYSNYIKGMLSGKSNEERTMIMRELDARGIMKKSFVDVASDRKTPNIEKIGILKNMSAIETGQVSTNNMMLSNTALDNLPVAKSILGDIIENPTKSIRFVAMLKGRSFGDSEIDIAIANNIDFTTDKTVTTSAAKFFSDNNNKWILDGMKKSLDKYRGSSYRKVNLNQQSLDIMLRNRLEVKKTKTEPQVELTEDIYGE